MYANNLSVESGRIAVVPLLKPFDGPMAGFCISLPIPRPGKIWVSVKTHKHPQKSKKRQVLWIDINIKQPTFEASHQLWVKAVSPHLFVGDATFLYIGKRSCEEYNRAVEAARSESRLSGAYRTDDTQVAVCVRLGDQEVTMKVTPITQGFRLTPVQNQ